MAFTPLAAWCMMLALCEIAVSTVPGQTTPSLNLLQLDAQIKFTIPNRTFSKREKHVSKRLRKKAEQLTHQLKQLPQEVVANIALIDLQSIEPKPSAIAVGSAVQLRLEKDPDVINVDDIIDSLGGLNKSLKNAGDVVDLVNDTALDVVSQVSMVIDAFQAILPAFQLGVDALKMLPGTKDLVDFAISFIESVNETVNKFDTKLSTIPTMITDAIGTTMPELIQLVDMIYNQFADAAEQVAALQNTTAELRRTAPRNVTAEPVHPQHRKRNAREKHHQVHPQHPEHDAGKNHDKIIASLMEARATRTDAEIVAESMDGAISSKGFWSRGRSKCAKAKDSIKKTNSSVSKYIEPITSLNDTANDLFDQILDTTSSAIDGLNASIMGALATAEEVIPRTILKPVEKGLSALMDITDEVVSMVEEASQKINDKIESAKAPLESILPLVDELQAAADEACDA